MACSRSLPGPVPTDGQIEDSESGIKAAKSAKLKNIFKFSKKSVKHLNEDVINFKNSKTILSFINKK
jgi:hypothetical protein